MGMNDETGAEVLVKFIDELLCRRVKAFKGEVPLPDGSKVPIEVSFDQTPRRETRPQLEDPLR